MQRNSTFCKSDEGITWECTRNLSIYEAISAKCKFDKMRKDNINRSTNSLSKIIIFRSNLFNWMPDTIQRTYLKYKVAPLILNDPDTIVDRDIRLQHIRNTLKLIFQNNLDHYVNRKRYATCYRSSNSNTWTCSTNLDLHEAIRIKNEYEANEQLYSTCDTQVIDLGTSSIYYPRFIQYWLLKFKINNMIRIMINDKDVHQ